jgi:hypothetical protein
MQSELLVPTILLTGFIILVFIESVPGLVRTLCLIGALVTCVYSLAKLWCLSDGWLAGSSICDLVNTVSTASLARSVSGLVPTITVIMVLIGLVSAAANIIIGFRNEDYGLIVAGALCGLIALSSAPAVQEPTILTVGMDALAMIVGVDAFIERGACYL